MSGEKNLARLEKRVKRLEKALLAARLALGAATPCAICGKLEKECKCYSDMQSSAGRVTSYGGRREV